MEYTDAPSSQTESTTGLTSRETLPGGERTAEGQASDAVAVLLSVVPGVGHVYKGYKILGLLFVIGALFAVLIGALAATATAGFGLALIPIYWFAVMFHVYAIPDRVLPASADDGEQY